MKVLALFLLTIFLNKGCCEGDAQKKVQKAQLIYTATSRGFFREIIIKNKEVSVQSNRKENIVTTKINDTDWKELIHLFNEVHLETIKDLKSPTEKRFYDGAAIAQLKIVFEGNTYESQSFDHGYPPEALQKLVTKINSFAKQNNEN